MNLPPPSLLSSLWLNYVPQCHKFSVTAFIVWERREKENVTWMSVFWCKNNFIDYAKIYMNKVISMEQVWRYQEYYIYFHVLNSREMCWLRTMLRTWVLKCSFIRVVAFESIPMKNRLPNINTSGITDLFTREAEDFWQSCGDLAIKRSLLELLFFDFVGRGLCCIWACADNEKTCYSQDISLTVEY